MKYLSPSFLATSIGALLLSTTANSAFAQSVAPSTTPQDLQRATPPKPEANRVTTVGQGQISLCPFSSSTIPVTINQVELSGGLNGAPTLSQAQIDKAFSDVRGKPTTLSVVCQIRQRLILAYRASGYPLTRVELPPQKISSDGVLRFTAVESTLQSVRIDDKVKSKPFTNIVEGYANQLRGNTEGVPLRWANVERFALLMRDTPGVVARLELRPVTSTGQASAPAAVEQPVPAPTSGEVPIATPGQTSVAPLDLYVSLEKPERFSGFVGVQRNSADVFGRYAGVLGGRVRGLLPWGGDELSGVVYSTQTGRQAVGLVTYEYHHPSGLQLKGTAAYARTAPGRQFAPLDLRGKSYSVSLQASYPIILRSAFQWEGTAGFDYVNQENFVFTDQATSTDRVRVASLGTNVLWRDVQDRKAKVQASAEYRVGVDAFNASQKGDPHLARADAKPQSSLWRLRAEGEYRIHRDWPGISVAADAQIANKSLLSFEQYQVGNLTFGRGYDPGTVTGDRGYGGRVELLGGRYAPKRLPDLQVEPYAFYDGAHVEQLSPTSLNPKRDLTSYGGGVRFRYSNKVSLDVGAAQALDIPGLNQKKPGPQFLMNLAYQF